MGRDAEQVNSLAINAGAKAEAYERSASEEPFWRFRRRAQLAHRARQARRAEAKLMKLAREGACESDPDRRAVPDRRSTADRRSSSDRRSVDDRRS